jgi:hypothetical protein
MKTLILSRSYAGIKEAIPAVKYMTQFFEHLRFLVLEEWYMVGEYVNDELLSTKGVLWNIKGRPDEKDLLYIESKVKNLLQGIRI